MIYNPNNNLFGELESFLNYYYSNTKIPISIYSSYLDSDHILFNTEQLTRKDSIHKINNFFHNKKIIEVWDYSLANIKILNSYGIKNTKYIPLKIWPEYEKKIKSYYSGNFLFDVAFCGWVGSEHRSALLTTIQKHNISLDIIENIYGEDRDKRIAKCKILLNIHFDSNYNIFEKLRCFAWIDIGKIVVSENSLDDDPRCINVSYDNILNTLKTIINK